MKPDPDSLRAVWQGVVTTCNTWLPRFAPGTAQHTQLTRRRNAFLTVLALADGAKADALPSATQQAARAPVESLLRKCKKAQTHVVEFSATHARLQRHVDACREALRLLHTHSTAP